MLAANSKRNVSPSATMPVHVMSNVAAPFMNNIQRRPSKPHCGGYCYCYCGNCSGARDSSDSSLGRRPTR